MVCSDCRMGGDLNKRAMDAFNEGRLDDFDDLKFKATVAHARCGSNGCFCQHTVGQDLLRKDVVRQ